MLRKTILFITLTFLLTASVIAQSVTAADEMGTSILRTKDGYLILNNGESVSYKLEFRGNDFKAIEGDHPMFLLDGKLLQVVTAAHKEFYKPLSTDKIKLTETQMLEKHQVWEIDYLSEQVGSHLSVTKEFLDLASKRKALFWVYELPKTIQTEFPQMAFLTTNVGDNVVGINLAFESGEQQNEGKKYLLETMNTLQISSTPYSIGKISEELKKGN